MIKLQFGLYSYATLYGTVNNYTTEGNFNGSLNINGYSAFFVVRNSFEWNSDVRFRKFIGSGITIPAGSVGFCGSNGNFTITFSSQDLNINPAQYVYDLFLDPTGAAFGLSSQIKSVGTGIFEILKGAKYGTF